MTVALKRDVILTVRLIGYHDLIDAMTEYRRIALSAGASNFTPRLARRQWSRGGTKLSASMTIALAGKLTVEQNMRHWARNRISAEEAEQ